MEVNEELSPSDTSTLPTKKPSKFRGRNSLTLAEKIMVIKEYHEYTQDTQILADKYKCSRTQIRSILRHKDEYLQEWGFKENPNRTRRALSTSSLATNVILFEYIKRCLGSLVPLNNELVKTSAKQISALIGFGEFNPTNKWMNRFKLMYNLRDFDNVQFDPQIAGKSLKVENIINDLQQELCIAFIPIKALSKKDINILRRYNCQILRTRFKNQNHNQNQNSFEEVDCIDLDSDSDSYEESQKRNREVVHYPFTYINGNLPQSMHRLEEEEEEDEEEPPLVISSYKEALEYLQKLENFTLLKEDLRSVGLISQLEVAFKEQLAKENAANNN